MKLIKLKKYIGFLLIILLVATSVFSGMAVFADNEGVTDTEKTETAFQKTLDRHDLYSAAYGNEVYVAVGSDGIIKTSTDGKEWDIAESHTTSLLNSIAYGGGRFIAVGSLGTILVSSNGKVWEKAVSGTDKNLISIAYNGICFAAVGDRGTILTSEDGMNWTKRPLEIGYSISSVISGNDKFVATVSDTFNIILVSENGTEWKTVEPDGENYGYYNAAFNGTQFFLNGRIPHTDGFVTVVSNDAVNWTKIQNSPKIRSIASNGKLYAAIGESVMQENGVLKQNIYTSENGIDWNTTGVNWDTYFSDLRFLYRCGRKYIGIKYSGEIYTSDDLINWTKEKLNLECAFETIVPTENGLAAYDKEGHIALSDDGKTWNIAEIVLQLEYPVIRIFFDQNKTFVIAGDPAKLYMTDDGEKWNTFEAEGLYYGKIFSSDGKYLLSAGTQLYVSYDAETWEKIQTGSQTLALGGIAFNGQIFVSVGGQGVIYGGEGNHSDPYRVMGTSSDMKTWNIIRSENTSSMNAVVFANGKFVAAGDSGTILVSEDGTVWNEAASNTSENLKDIVWDGYRFIASGEKGTVIQSKDGNLWSSCNVQTSDTIAELIPVGNKLIGIGYRSVFSGVLMEQTEIREQKAFEDIKNHWAKDYITELAQKNLVNGVDDSHFEPDRSITRAEFAAILVRALDLKTQGNGNAFADVSVNDWFYEIVNASYENGILKGYDNGYAKPNNSITREEAMVMITRAMKLENIDTAIVPSEITTALSMFLDKDSVSGWASEPAAVCVKSNIIIGNNGYLKPADPITRAETAAIVLRMLDRAG